MSLWFFFTNEKESILMRRSDEKGQINMDPGKQKMSINQFNWHRTFTHAYAPTPSLQGLLFSFFNIHILIRVISILRLILF